MKFPYKVRHNGVDYPIGADVPIEISIGEGVKAPAFGFSREEVKDDEDETSYDLPFMDYDDVNTRKYTEEDLNVSIQSLRKMAKDNNIKFSNKDKAEALRQKLRTL